MIIAQEKTGHSRFSYEEAPRPKKNRRRKRVTVWHRFMLTGLVLAGFMVGLVIIYYYSQVFALGHQINCLEKELVSLRVDNHNLKEEIQRLASLDRVEYLAVNKLGMVKPDSSDILIVAVTDKTPPITETKPMAGETAGISPAGEGKNRLIKAFTELVDRLENKIWLGHGPSAGSEEGANANNKHINPQKNHMGLYNRYISVIGTDYPPCLDPVG